VASTTIYPSPDLKMTDRPALEHQIGERVAQYVRGIGASSSRQVRAQAALLVDLAAGTGSIWAGDRRIGTFHLERLGEEVKPDAGPTD
jgi:hypothetical protein